MADGKFKIKGKGNIPGYVTDLDIEVNDKYEAYSKPVPDPTPFENGEITWFNSFGVRDKVTGKDFNIRYKVTIDNLPAGKRLFYMVNNTPVEITRQGPDKKDGQYFEENGRTHYFLNLGDPPNGLYP